ncbi:lipoprotein [Williamsoniiplasma luminosum]|uniref:Lipoprotein n=1 Tax=Williamsoniiplasma luminosum TaxID=214888 RepID=A0A2S0NJZ0_9MOLU|nr:lipoprotein [Williamsoniiplasma luminosum]AVP49330.1 MAG: hypothetical protein C5T88_01910 [Williamsoniiplasma luminosum]
MKKLLTLLGSIGMVAATAATVVACNPGKNEDKPTEVKVGETKTIDISTDLIKDFDVKSLEVKETGKDALLENLGFDKKEAPTKITFKGKTEGTTTIELKGNKIKPKTDKTGESTLDFIAKFTIEVKGEVTLTKVKTQEVKAAIDKIAMPETAFATKELAKKAIEDVLNGDAWKTKVTGVVTIDQAEKNYSVLLTAATGHELVGAATITGSVKIVKTPGLIKVNTKEVNDAIGEVTNSQTFDNMEAAKSAIEDVLGNDPWKTKVTGVVTITKGEDNYDYSVLLTAATGHELVGAATIKGTVNIVDQVEGKNITELIKFTDLGEIDDTEDETILNAINKKM